MVTFFAQYWDILDKLPRSYRSMKAIYNILNKIYWEFPQKFSNDFDYYRSELVNIGKQIVNEVRYLFKLSS